MVQLLPQVSGLDDALKAGVESSWDQCPLRRAPNAPASLALRRPREVAHLCIAALRMLMPPVVAADGIRVDAFCTSSSRCSRYDANAARPPLPHSSRERPAVLASRAGPVHTSRVTLGLWVFTTPAGAAPGPDAKRGSERTRERALQQVRRVPLVRPGDRVRRESFVYTNS